ncbi:MAG: M20/M25/M40 family metallo-hydrolase [Deltaproteobacteria bacterium]|nr:M20/M25/M40 family metallo-hydrolase [Deltaproteobacteria bacterium]
MELDLLQIARDLVGANTVSSRGTADAVAVLQPLYEKLGWTVRVLEGPESTPSARQLNLLARAPGSASGEGFLAVTHLDTVDPGPRELWKSDPFVLTGEGERIVGLGSADVKIDAACKLLAFARLKDAAFARPLAFLGTYMEEVGCKGARNFATLQRDAFPARYVACGEPSELRIIDAHKGYVVVRVRITDRQPKPLAGPFRSVHVLGKAAHSSTPHLGENAILKAWPELRGVGAIDAGSVANKVPAELRAHVADPNGSVKLDGAFDLDPALQVAHNACFAWTSAIKKTSPGPNARFNPADAVCNWGVLESQGANVEAIFDARLVPGQSPQAVFGYFEPWIQKHVDPRFDVTVQIERSNEAMQLQRPSALLDAAQAASKALGLDPEPQAKPTNTEAGVFASAGYESIVFGPGVSTGNAHCANEVQLVSQCRTAIDFYEALARKLCVKA